MKSSEAIQAQIDFLKAETTKWVKNSPRQPNQACAIIRMRKDRTREYVVGTDHLTADKYIKQAITEYTEGKYKNIISYNDRSDCTKKDILNILRKARDLAIAAGE